MEDSSIKYNLSVTGADESVAQLRSVETAAKSASTATSSNASAAASGATGQENLSKSTDKAVRSTNNASSAQENYFVHIAKTTVQSALVNKAFLGLVASAGDAVKQVDLFTNFPAAMGALGLSTTDASESLKKLTTYAAAAGISVTDATQSVTRFAEVTKDVKAATIEFVGVKNALIAGAAPADQQANALEQLTQAYSRGKPQLIEWRSLMVAMPAQLTAVAKAMGQPNAQVLGEQLTKGKISMQDFMTELTKLATGSGVIAQQTAVHMQGIEFASNVMKQTLTNGLAAIYEAIGRQNIISFFTFMTQVIQVASGYVVILINDLISLFNIVSKIFGGPQISVLSKDLKDSTGAGAANAADMADGLGDAADNAAKITKSLAGFDKMDVLPDKTSSATPAADGGQNGLDPADAATLDDLFNKFSPSLGAATEAAKVFAGILSALAGNALISKLFGVNPLKDLIKGIGDAGKGFLGLGKNIEDVQGDADKAGDSIGKSLGTKIGEGAKGGISKMATIIAGAVGGIASATAGAVAPALAGVFTAIGTAIAGALAAGAAFLGVSIGVFIAIIIAVVAVIVGIIWLIWTNWQTIWGFMKAVFDAVVGAIVVVWNTLFDIFKAPVEFIWQFITAIFILIVAIVATALQLIFQLIVGAIALIYNVLAAIADWVYNNVILPVANFFQALWDGIVAAVTAAWNFIFNTVLKPIGTWIYANVITPVVNFFQSMWDTISGFVSGFVTGVYNFLRPLGSWIYNNVISPIAGFFQGLWDGIVSGLRGAFGLLQSVFGSLGGVVKAPINGVIDLMNDVLKSLNKIKVPDWVPGLGGKGVNFPLIPKLAKGGIVSKATTATIGEDGAEAIVPLENNTQWIDTLVSKINDKQGTGMPPVQLVVQIGEDHIVSKVIDLINEKTNMSGKNTIYV